MVGFSLLWLPFIPLRFLITSSGPSMAPVLPGPIWQLFHWISHPNYCHSILFDGLRTVLCFVSFSFKRIVFKFHSSLHTAILVLFWRHCNLEGLIHYFYSMLSTQPHFWLEISGSHFQIWIHGLLSKIDYFYLCCNFPGVIFRGMCVCACDLFRSSSKTAPRVCIPHSCAHKLFRTHPHSFFSVYFY